MPQLTTNFAPEGTGNAVPAGARMSGQRSGMGMIARHSREAPPEQGRSTLPDAHDYDDGLVHGHAWAGPAHRRHAPR